MSAATRAKTAHGRAGVASRMIIARKRGAIHCRAFDDCFEMSDGDEVARILTHRAKTDPVLAWHCKKHWGDSNDQPQDWWLPKAAATNPGWKPYRCPDPIDDPELFVGLEGGAV